MDTALGTPLEELLAPICHAHGVELVDVRKLREPAGAVLRVILDRPRPEGALGSTISLQDCSAVSRDASAALDVRDDLLSGHYRLEVSSPGPERPLVRRADFERFAGRPVSVRTQLPVGGQRHFQGTLLGLVEDEVRVDQDGDMAAIPWDLITRAHLVVEA
ncbi:MAG: ribosome maturation factor RimP [Deltaproteobacteria bacterium]|nr:ribosome maturation factor RimP [Deltaproteobacteria bacterium]